MHPEDALAEIDQTDPAAPPRYVLMLDMTGAFLHADHTLAERYKSDEGPPDRVEAPGDRDDDDDDDDDSLLQLQLSEDPQALHTYHLHGCHSSSFFHTVPFSKITNKTVSQIIGALPPKIVRVNG